LALDTVGLLPIIPSTATVKGAVNVVDNLTDAGRLADKVDDVGDVGKTVKNVGDCFFDGARMKTDEALDAAEDFLGRGYRDMGVRFEWEMPIFWGNMGQDPI
jgi:hypothetical protein